jgi:hypothetical protein
MDMDKIIGMCGLVCNKCPAYIATQKNDDMEREKVAKLWAEEYKTNISPNEINCDGCTGGGRIFSYPTICGIRNCGIKREVDNCAYCDDYVCEKLNEFFILAPQAKEMLESIRKGH